MQKIKAGVQALFKYPITLVFFAFVLVFMAADLATPDHAVSELENRPLTQAPTFNVNTLVQNEWTAKYDTYTKDQFLLRDEWITLWSVFETAQMKLESNGVWLAQDGYQIAQNTVLTAGQQQRLPINTGAVAQLAQRHAGHVSVLIVPSAANILSDHLRWNPPQIDENGILDDMFAQFRAAGANVVDVRPAFMANIEDDLYYRTDHHWTTTGGAWLAYQAFCEAQGLNALPPQAELLESVPGFYGTNFSKTKYVGTQPDTLHFYNFDTPLIVYRMQESGTLLPEEGPLMDMSRLSAYDKYAAFLRGNNAYSTMQGQGEGSILVIKDSYGNCFSPYLLQNYARIGILDLRYALDVDSYYLGDAYDDILVLYSFASFSEDMYANRMQDAQQKPPDTFLNSLAAPA